MHTFTGLIFPYRRGFLKQILIFMDKTLCWAATSVYPEGAGVKNHLMEYGITKKSLKIIANGNINGIDLSFYDPYLINSNDRNAIRKSFGVLENDFVFLYIGRVVKEKGIEELVDAFIRFSATNVKLLIVGSTNEESGSISLDTLEKIGNSESIHLFPFQIDVRPFFSIANVFVLPSYREGFPNVVLQAGAMNLPCIVSDVSGCNEIIKDGINGLIVPPRDSQGLFDSMQLLFQNGEILQKLAGNARHLISEKYDQQFVWNCLLDEYNLQIQKHCQ
jgi:glycosyltransferase involved in cell wall biosynthesis